MFQVVHFPFKCLKYSTKTFLIFLKNNFENEDCALHPITGPTELTLVFLNNTHRFLESKSPKSMVPVRYGVRSAWTSQSGFRNLQHCRGQRLAVTAIAIVALSARGPCNSRVQVSGSSSTNLRCPQPGVVRSRVGHLGPGLRAKEEGGERKVAATAKCPLLRPLRWCQALRRTCPLIRVGWGGAITWNLLATE